MFFEQVDQTLFSTPSINFSYHALWVGWQCAVFNTQDEHFIVFNTQHELFIPCSLSRLIVCCPADREWTFLKHQEIDLQTNAMKPVKWTHYNNNKHQFLSSSSFFILNLWILHAYCNVFITVVQPSTPIQMLSSSLDVFHVKLSQKRYCWKLKSQDEEENRSLTL